MKNQYKALIALMLCGIFSTAQCQVLLEQFFETPNQVPSGWTATPFVTSGWAGWRIGTSSNLSSNFFSIPGNSGVAAVNDDNAGQNGSNPECLLTTPSVDLSTIDEAYLTFSLYYKNSHYPSIGPREVGQLWVSTNGGADFTLVEEFEGNSTEWQSKVLNLAPYLGQSSVRFRFRYSDSGSWNDGMAIDNVRIFKPESNEVALVSYNLQTTEYVGLGNRQISATIRNAGSTPLSTIRLTYVPDGGSPVTAELTLNPPLPFNATRLVNHPTFWNITTPGSHTVEVSVSLPNGTDDPTPDDNTLNSSLVALSFIPEKKIVLEEYTSNTCGYCPWGHRFLEQVVAQNDDVIPVAVHGEMIGPSDLDIPEGVQAMQGLGMNAFPQLAVNRYKMPWDWITGIGVEDAQGSYGVSIWNQAIAENRNVPAPASVSIFEQEFDPVTRQFRITVEGQFYAPITDDFRFNVYLVENNVTGTGPGYDQSNYMNDQQGTPFYNLGNPIVGYVHKHVLRAMLGGSWGTAQSIPSSVQPGTVYRRTYTYTVPGDWKANDINVVASIMRFNQDRLKRPIINSVSNRLTNNITPAGGDITITTTGGDGVYCPGESFGLNISVEGNPGANNTYQVQLSSASGSFAAPTTIATPSGTGSITVTLPQSLDPGTNYRVRVAASDPISYSQPFNIQILGPLEVSFTSSTTVFNQGRGPYSVNFVNTSPVTDGVTFEWDFGDGQTATGINASHDYSDTAAYEVRLRALVNGKPCTENQFVLNIVVSDVFQPQDTDTTSVVALRLLRSLAVYPNPAREKFEIRRLDATGMPLVATLTDVRGSVLFQTSMDGSVQSLSIPVANLGAGLYLLRLSAEGAELFHKIHVVK
jgi:thiol-disulfide isomerase/thioredoxin